MNSDATSDRSDAPSAQFPNLQSVKAAIDRGKQLSAYAYVTVVEVGDVVIKYGRHVYKSEGLAMQLVRSATTVPVPLFLAYFSETSDNREDRSGYLVMKKVPGVPLVKVLPHLDESACKSITSQLRTYVAALRSIPSNGKWGIVGRNGLFHGGHFRYMNPPYTEDQQLYGNPCVASCTRDVFEYFARASEDMGGGRHPSIAELSSGIDFSRPAVFSHGDLVPENILVDEASGTITSIIDWEHAGWYPYFWDASVASIRLSAYQNNPITSERWRRMFRVAITDGSDDPAVKAFTDVHFHAYLSGRDECPTYVCHCCF